MGVSKGPLDLYKGAMDLYADLMDRGPSPEQRFSRGDLCRLSGISDGVAAFWLKNGLLLPTGDSAGRGNHRQFDRMQVSIAAILAELQKHGVNIARLTSFAMLLQKGVDKCDKNGLHPYSMWTAATLSDRIRSFRSGEEVRVSLYHVNRPANRRLERIVATSEQQIILDAWSKSDYATPQQIADFAETLGEEDVPTVRLYRDIRSELDGLDTGDPSWLIWPDGAGWGFTESPDQLQGFGDVPKNLSSALYLGVGAIVRRTWSIDKFERDRSYMLARLREETRPDFREAIQERLNELEETHGYR